MKNIRFAIPAAALIVAACGDAPTDDAMMAGERAGAGDMQTSPAADSEPYVTRVGFMGQTANGEKVLYASREIELTREQNDALWPALEDYVRGEYAGGDGAQIMKWSLAGETGDEAMQEIIDDNESRGRETVIIDVPIDDLID